MRLYPFQREGVDFLRRHPRALLGDEMGLGKSCQALNALDDNARQHQHTIVVCPAGLRRNWADETRQWRPDLAPRIALEGDIIPEKGEVVITSWDHLPPSYPSSPVLSDLFAKVIVIFDEVHYAKNHQAQRTQKARILAQRCARVWGLSGTPLPDRATDLYGVLRTLGLEEKAFGSWKQFLQVMGGIDRTGKPRVDKWGKNVFLKPDMKRAREMLSSVMLRRTRQEVLPDLPQKVYTDIPVELAPTAADKDVLETAEKKWQLYGAEDLPPFEMFSEALRLLAEAKIPAMIEEVARFEEEEVPLLVFSAHSAPLDALRGRKGWGVIMGDTSDKARDVAKKAFQAGSLNGLAVAIKAGGVGLTLTRASHELFVDRSCTPADNLQAEDRTVRIGQEAKSVQVRRLVADHPLDRRLAAILTAKQNLISGVVG